MFKNILPEWNELPESMQNEYVRKYYDIIKRKKTELKIKRLFDTINIKYYKL